MKCTLVGRESRAGEGKKGKYDFVMLYIAGNKQGVEGQATDKIFLSRDRHPHLCSKAESLVPGERIEIHMEREIGSNMETVVDIVPVDSLSGVEDSKPAKVS